ncbi:MAG: hypothetical protein QOC74_4637 [Pseudonocardiales bacterium]|jgi:hypothetical protein|nr:hypothetical protein [Pseudonocardiales bacterium]
MAIPEHAQALLRGGWAGESLLPHAWAHYVTSIYLTEGGRGPAATATL